MDDLVRAPPHVRDGDRYSAVEWRVYVRGYDHALEMALRVMPLAVERCTLARRTRRREARQERSA